MRNNFPILIFFCLLITTSSCDNNTQTAGSAKETTSENDKKDEIFTPAAGNIELQAPDFADPASNKYYSDYTSYLKRVVTAIRSQDEEATMKLFREEGKQFDNINEMEEHARSTPEEEQKFTTWLMQSMPLQKEVVQSLYYKKFNEEYYKKVKEDFKKKEL